MKHKKTFLITVLIIVAIIAFFTVNSDVLNKKTDSSIDKIEVKKTGDVQIGDIIINVEIADTPRKREKGLSGRNNLPENQGMFFIFESAGKYEFWMKDMHFPIDIVWIDNNYKIVDITHSVREDSFPQSFLPRVPARYVLEVGAGFSVKNVISIGNNISFFSNPS